MTANILEMLIYLKKWSEYMALDIYSTKTTMQNELNIIKISQQLFGISPSEFTYMGDKRDEITAYFKELINGWLEQPAYSSNVDLQKAGYDIGYKGVALDIKAHKACYNRMFLELYLDAATGLYSFNKDSQSNVMVHIMERDNTIFCFPLKMLEDIINKNAEYLCLPDDFYYNKQYFDIVSSKDTKRHGTIGFAISPYAISDKLRNFISSDKATNSTVRFLLNGYKPYTDKENQYV